jgi:hypothetical protein
VGGGRRAFHKRSRFDLAILQNESAFGEQNPRGGELLYKTKPLRGGFDCRPLYKTKPSNPASSKTNSLRFGHCVRQGFHKTNRPATNRIRQAAEPFHKTNPLRRGSIAARSQNEAVQPSVFQNELLRFAHCVRQRFTKRINLPRTESGRRRNRSTKRTHFGADSIAACLQNEAVQPSVFQNELAAVRTLRPSGISQNEPACHEQNPAGG